MDEIDLKELLQLLKKRALFIAFITILCTGISGVVSFYIFAPVYQTYTTLMIGRPQEYAGKIEYDDVLLNQKLVSTYGEIVKSRIIADELIEKLKLNLTYEKLGKKINVTLLKDTEIIKISVKDKDRKMAAKIANEIAGVFIKYVAQIMHIENIQIIDKAEVPLKPIKPRPIINMIVTFIVASMISTCAVIIREYLDNTIKSSEEIEKKFNLPVVGIVPKLLKAQGNNSKNNDKIIIHKDQNPLIIEAFRTLRTNIQFSGIDKALKNILITSSIAAEGKTVTSINLAYSISRTEKKVILIDCDLRKPKIHDYFDILNSTGLTTALATKIDYKNFIQVIYEGKLDLLTSGPIPPNPSELLGSKRMQLLLERVKQDYDVVILDSPSAGIVTDAAVLSTKVDGTIFVCEVGRTEMEEVNTAKAALENVNANIIGVILNKVAIEKGTYYYE